MDQNIKAGLLKKCRNNLITLYPLPNIGNEWNGSVFVIKFYSKSHLKQNPLGAIPACMESIRTAEEV